MSRKPRIPGTGDVPAMTRLKQQPRDVQVRVFGWCEELTLKEVRQRIATELDIHFTADSQITRWRQSFEDVVAMERFADLLEMAEEGAAQHVGRTAAREKAISWAMSLAAMDRDPKLMLKAVATGQKESSLAQDDRKIALLEAKAKQAEQAGDIAEDTRLTPEEKEQKLRAIFGLS